MNERKESSKGMITFGKKKRLSDASKSWLAKLKSVENSLLLKTDSSNSNEQKVKESEDLTKRRFGKDISNTPRVAMVDLPKALKSKRKKSITKILPAPNHNFNQHYKPANRAVVLKAVQKKPKIVPKFQVYKDGADLPQSSSNPLGSKLSTSTWRLPKIQSPVSASPTPRGKSKNQKITSQTSPIQQLKVNPETNLELSVEEKKPDPNPNSDASEVDKDEILTGVARFCNMTIKKGSSTAGIISNSAVKISRALSETSEDELVKY